MLNSRSIHFKILITYLFIFVMIVISGIFSGYCFIGLSNTVKNLVYYDMGAATFSRRIYSTLSTLEGNHRTFVWFGDPQVLSMAENNIKQIQSYIDTLYTMKLSSEAITYLTQLRDGINKIADELKEDAKKALPSTGLPNRQQRSQQLKKEYKQLRTITYNLNQQIQSTIERKTTNLSHKSDQLAWILIGADTIILILFIVLPLVIYKNLIKTPLLKLKYGTQCIADGNFSYKINITSPDEFGDLAKAFNNMGERLQELDQMKSDFIAIITHELRTPLSSMIEAVNLLSEITTTTAELSKEDIIELANVVKDDLKRLNTLVDDVLDLSRLEAKLMTLNVYPTDLLSCIKNVIQSLRPLALEKGVELVLNTKEEAAVLNVDEEKIHRVFLNLLNNAIKFTPADSKITITLEKAEKKNWIKVTVTDQGPGISKNEQNLIFDKFYQVKMKKQRGGSGLGLTIAKEIITAHHGKISVKSPAYISDSHIGIGTSFIVEIPSYPKQQ